MSRSSVGSTGRRRASVAVAASLLLVVGSACGDAGDVIDGEEVAAVATPLGFTGGDIVPIDAELLEGDVLGLQVATEDVADRLVNVRDTYVQELSLYSLRRGELLMATLQVSRLGGPARPDDRDFRAQVVNKIGGTAPREVRLGDMTVWLTTGNGQHLQAWFRDDLFFVLSIRSDYERPRSLLRELLEVGA